MPSSNFCRSEDKSTSSTDLSTLLSSLLLNIVMFSLMEAGNITGSCGKYPIVFKSGLISFPSLSSKIIFPALGANSPNINLNRVDLPVPESPVKRIFSP